MEIITYVREGAITHQDSLGNKGRTEAGDVQVMSAGSGIRHAEYNLENRADADLPDLDRADRPGGAPVLGRQALPQGATAPAASSLWPAALPRTRTRCRSAPMPACSARR